MKIIRYLGEKMGAGLISDLYRMVKDGEKTVFEKYEVKKHGWVESLEAKGAFMGEGHTWTVSPEEAQKTIALWEENYKKYLKLHPEGNV